MATIRKRNSKWQVQVRRIGYPAISRTFLKKSHAIAWGSLQEIDLEGSTVKSTTPPKITLGELLDKYTLEVLPLKRAPEPELYMLKVLRRHAISKLPLAKITSSDFANLRNERLKMVMPSTVRRQFNVLRHALRIAQREWGWITPYAELQNLDLPPIASTMVQRLSVSDQSDLLRAADAQSNMYVGSAIRIALATGLRRGELLALAWEDIDRDNLVVRMSKNGRSRRFPLSDETLQLIHKLPRNSKTVIPISANCLRMGFERARSKAGLKVRFHDLRHEAISRLFELGLTLPEVKAISGHQTLSQLTRYAHADERALARKVKHQLLDIQS